MKTALVMEGGAMKGMFTAGVLDVFMDNGITFDAAIGVSAGATFGINIKSGQNGRAIRYNKRFCQDKRYASVRNYLTTGDLYGVDFCYRELPWELDLWDDKAYRENPMRFFVVATDVETGMPVYHECPYGDDRDMDWIRASASMPILSRIVEIDGHKLLDGGTSDSIPLKHMEDEGYDRIVVITTKPYGFRRGKETKLITGFKLRYRRYPDYIEAMKSHSKRYNETMDYIEKRENDPDIVVIRPPEDLLIKGVERDIAMFDYTYMLGRKEGEKSLPLVRKLLEN